MRFNPPPNWPPPPPDWVPDGNWAPDPSWPPPPPGWQLWVDDSAPLYPPQAPWGYPPQWPPQRPPRSALRKTMWIALAVTAAVIVAVAAVFAVGAGGKSTSASRKADITHLTRDLLVDKSAFPDYTDARRSSGVGSNAGKASALADLSIEPQECADLYGYTKSATQTAYAAVSKVDRSGPRSLEVNLAITPDRLNLKEYLKNCQSFTASLKLAGRTVTFKAGLEPLDVSGVPPWAIATVMKSSGKPFRGIPLTISLTTATISGYYRGVLVVAGYNQLGHRGKKSASIDADDANDLVRLFNAQVQKLEAAP
jgi:hypothetical protein